MSNVMIPHETIEKYGIESVKKVIESNGSVELSDREFSLLVMGFKLGYSESLNNTMTLNRKN